MGKRLYQFIFGQKEVEVKGNYHLLNSGMIHSTRYDWRSGRLFIQFLDGKEYAYFRVSSYVYNAFLNSENHSNYFESFIKNRYLSVSMDSFMFA